MQQLLLTPDMIYKENEMRENIEKEMRETIEKEMREKIEKEMREKKLMRKEFEREYWSD